MAAFVCSGLSVTYGGREALSDINFELPAGAFLVVVGENGSGKSTLIKALLGLIKPLSGSIRLGGGLKKETSAICRSRGRHVTTFPPPSTRSSSQEGLPTSACAHFTTGATTGRPRKTSVWPASGSCVQGPFANFRAGSSRGRCWRAPSAPPAACCCSTNRRRDLTRRRRKVCTRCCVR